MLAQALGWRQGVSGILFQKAIVADAQGDWDAQRAFIEAQLRIEQELDNIGGIGSALMSLGAREYDTSNYPDARRLFEQALALFGEIGNWFMQNWARFNLTRVELEAGDLVRAEAYARTILEQPGIVDQPIYAAEAHGWQSLSLLAQGNVKAAVDVAARNPAQTHEWHRRHTYSDVVMCRGYLAAYTGKLIEARAYLEESVELARTSDWPLMVRYPLVFLADVAVMTGDIVRASACLSEALPICQRVGARWNIARALECTAGIAEVQGHITRAAHLWGAAEALREQIGARMWPIDRPEYERRVAAARSQIAPEDFDAAWAAGRTLTWEQAVAEALAVGT